MYRVLKQFSPHFFHSLALLLLFSLLLNGCASQQRVYYPKPSTTPAPPTAPAPVPSSPIPEAAPATKYEPATGQATALYNKADEALSAGQYSEAELLLERALRIEPQNAHYWYTLAQVKYLQRQYPQTVQFCLKADSLAASQPQLTSLNRELLEKAKNKLNN